MSNVVKFRRPKPKKVPQQNAGVQAPRKIPGWLPWIGFLAIVIIVYLLRGSPA